MKLDQIMLILLAIGAVFYVGAMVAGMMQIMPYGLIGLVITLIFLWIIGRVIYERLSNKEDDYYEKHIDK